MWRAARTQQMAMQLDLGQRVREGTVRILRIRLRRHFRDLRRLFVDQQSGAGKLDIPVGVECTLDQGEITA